MNQNEGIAEDPKATDVLVRNEGTIFLFRPMTKAGEQWIAENVDDTAQWFGPSLVVEHRYAADLAAGMVRYGLRLGDM